MGMIPFFPDMRRRADLPELMDMPDSDPQRLRRTLAQFDLVNRYLSRSRHILKRFFVSRMMRDPKREYHLVDLGAGACETAVWLLRHCRRCGLQLRVTACDHDPRVVEYARGKYGGEPRLEIIEGDALDIAALAPFDFVFANHLLHHLCEDELRRLFSGLAEFPNSGILFNDLRRSRGAYAAYYLLSPAIFRGGFARYDGLLSIRKGFRRSELAALAESAGPRFGDYRIMQFHPGRIVLWRPDRD
jgi:SAM-dependent methyltransferase